MNIYDELDFQMCMDRVLDTQDMYMEMHYTRMSDSQLHEFITQTQELQKQVQATLLAMKYIQGVREERKSWKTTTQDMKYAK